MCWNISLRYAFELKQRTRRRRGGFSFCPSSEEIIKHSSMFHQCLHTLGGCGSDGQTHVEVHYERAGGRLLRTRTPAISVLLLVCLHGPDTSE